MDGNIADSIPMVSVFMITYNHGKYIKKALDSILMQKVNFSYEIVIGDDYSQDTTRDILREYSQTYPFKINLLLHEKNLGMHENVNEVWRNCRGKYIASCEGDDYWIDPNKLQKQVDFLEQNPQYVGTAHKVQVVDHNGKIYTTKTHFNFKKNIFTLTDAKKGYFPGQTGTLVYKNILKVTSADFKALTQCKSNGDEKLRLFLVLHGNFYCFDNVMSHYRKVVTHGDSWTASTSGKNMSLHSYYNYEELLQLASKIKNVDIDFREQFLKIFILSFLKFIQKPNDSNFNILKNIYIRYKKRFKQNKVQIMISIIVVIIKSSFIKMRKLLIKDI